MKKPQKPRLPKYAKVKTAPYKMTFKLAKIEPENSKSYCPRCRLYPNFTFHQSNGEDKLYIVCICKYNYTLPLDSYIKRLPTMQHNTYKCQNHPDDPAVIYCESCKYFLCSKCFINHNNQFKSHYTIQTDDNFEEYLMGKYSEYYCLTCKEYLSGLTISLKEHIEKEHTIVKIKLPYKTIDKYLEIYRENKKMVENNLKICEKLFRKIKEKNEKLDRLFLTFKKRCENFLFFQLLLIRNYSNRASCYLQYSNLNLASHIRFLEMPSELEEIAYTPHPESLDIDDLVKKMTDFYSQFNFYKIVKCNVDNFRVIHSIDESLDPEQCTIKNIFLFQNNKKIVFYLSNGIMEIYDVITYKRLTVINVNTKKNIVNIWKLNEEKIIFVLNNQSMQIYQIYEKNLKCEKLLAKAHDQEIITAVSLNDDVFVSGSKDQTIKFWEGKDPYNSLNSIAIKFPFFKLLFLKDKNLLMIVHKEYFSFLNILTYQTETYCKIEDCKHLKSDSFADLGNDRIAYCSDNKIIVFNIQSFTREIIFRDREFIYFEPSCCINLNDDSFLCVVKITKQYHHLYTIDLHDFNFKHKAVLHTGFDPLKILCIDKNTFAYTTNGLNIQILKND